MTNRDIVSLLLYEAGRRPEINDLVERIDTLSDDEIASAVVPLPWYRKALIELRKQKEVERLARDIEDHIETGVNPDMPGIVRRCVLAVWVRGNFSYLEVLPGQLSFFPKGGGMWVGTAFFPEVNSELLNGEFVTETTFSHYKQLEQERIIGSNAVIPATVNPSEDNGALSRLSSLGVRVDRL